MVEVELRGGGGRGVERWRGWRVVKGDCKWIGLGENRSKSDQSRGLCVIKQCVTGDDGLTRGNVQVRSWERGEFILWVEFGCGEKRSKLEGYGEIR